VVNLFPWGASPGLELLENHTDAPHPWELELPAAGALRGELCARSLRGRHHVELG